MSSGGWGYPAESVDQTPGAHLPQPGEAGYSDDGSGWKSQVVSGVVLEAGFVLSLSLPSEDCLMQKLEFGTSRICPFAMISHFCA